MGTGSAASAVGSLTCSFQAQLAAIALIEANIIFVDEPSVGVKRLPPCRLLQVSNSGQQDSRPPPVRHYRPDSIHSLAKPRVFAFVHRVDLALRVFCIPADGPRAVTDPAMCSWALTFDHRSATASSNAPIRFSAHKSLRSRRPPLTRRCGLPATGRGKDPGQRACSAYRVAARTKRD